MHRHLPAGGSQGQGHLAAEAPGGAGDEDGGCGHGQAIWDDNRRVNKETSSVTSGPAAAAAAAVQATAARHGRLDVLCANAGIQHRSPIVDFPIDDFRRVIETNLTAVWALAKEAARVMQPARRGRIVITGSMTALAARPTVSAYIASKGAVHALTRSLAVELGPHGVTVNCIAPGYFGTEMNAALVQDEAFSAWVTGRTPVGRWGRPEEIGAAAVYLASDEAAFVNGHTLVVDGGFTAAL